MALVRCVAQRSADGGESWVCTPEQLGYRDPTDYEASYPYLVSVSDSELRLIYLDGPNQGRSQRISRDGGLTWSDPLRIIDEMEGVNGYVVPVVDGNQQPHLIINMRTRNSQVVGIYYATWLADRWSPVAPVRRFRQGAALHGRRRSTGQRDSCRVHRALPQAKSGTFVACCQE